MIANNKAIILKVIVASGNRALRANLQNVLKKYMVKNVSQKLCCMANPLLARTDFAAKNVEY